MRYYKLFDLLNRRSMKISDLRQIISSATVAKLKKGEYISGEVTEKICLFLHCQPGDIMEVVEIEDEHTETANEMSISYVLEADPNAELIKKEYFIETHPENMDIAESDANTKTKRQYIKTDIE